MAGSAPWSPKDFKMIRKELTPKVHAVLPDDTFRKDHSGTNAGFVVGEKGVLVVESLLSRDLAQQLIAAIGEVTDKPLRFLTNTSYHGDHTYGNCVFDDETVIIHHQATKDFIDQHFEEDKKFMLGFMEGGIGIEEATPRSADISFRDSLRLDLGGTEVELLHLGFAQTPGDLVVWIPSEKVAFVGNMLQAPPPAFPWLLEGRHKETLATLQKFYDFLDDDATVIPGHGKPMSRKEILFHIEYVKELDASVGAAVRDSKSLPETKELAQLKRYATYSLYPFVHFEVNIPAVYKELSTA